MRPRPTPSPAPPVYSGAELPAIDSPAAAAVIHAAYVDAHSGRDHQAVFELLCRYAGVDPVTAVRDGVDVLDIADPGDGPGQISAAFQAAGREARRALLRD